MKKFSGNSAFELIHIIANFGAASKILKKAKELGIPGGTIFLAKGTVNNSFLNFLSLYDERKEVILMGAKSSIVDAVLPKLNEEFQFEKPNHGIIFTTCLFDIIGSKRCELDIQYEQRGVKKSMYKNIITIVNRGKAEEVIEAAKEAGSKGGTIINARGSGVHETMKVFNMDIEPEKEIVIILSKDDVTEAIVNSITEKLEIDRPGKGIIFVQDVNQVYGIYDK